MRCRSCNAILTDREAVTKDDFGDYYELCNICLAYSNGFYPLQEEEDYLQYEAWEEYSNDY